MALLPRLRIHLVGSDLAEKAAMAKALRTELYKQKERYSALIVPVMIDRVKERWATEDIHFFLGLESEYLKMETDRDTKAKHIIFLDSAVDRYLRVRERNVNLEVFFQPQLEGYVNRPGHLFLYGPSFDKARSEVIQRFNLPTQTWSSIHGKVPEMVESALLRVRRYK